MFDRTAEWMASYWAGIGSLPGWAIAVAAIVALCALVPLGPGIKGLGGLLARGTLAVVLVSAVGWGLDRLARRDLAAEQRALDARAFELAARALAPGSPLACL